MELVETSNQSGIVERHVDVTGDGKAESVAFCEYGEIISVEIYGDKGRFISAKRLVGVWPPKLPFHVFGDYDRDGKGEIYVLTRKHDSLLLHMISDFSSSEPYVRTLVVGETRSIGDKYDFLFDAKMVDLDNDQEGELLFRIHGGFSLVPRRLYVFHPDENRLVSSEDFGIGLFNQYLFDLDGDGDLEILSGTAATENYPDSAIVPIVDWVATGMIFDHELNLLRMTEIYSDNKPAVHLQPFVNDKDTLIVQTHIKYGGDGNMVVTSMDPSLEIKDTLYSGPELLAPFMIVNEHGETRIVLRENVIEALRYLDNDGSMVTSEVNGYISVPSIFDSGVREEQWLIMQREEIFFVDFDLNVISNSIPVEAGIDYYTRDIQQNEDRELLFIYLNNDSKKLLSLRKSAAFQFRFFIYLATALSIGLIVFLSLWLIRFLYLRRRFLEYQVQVHQLQSVHNQMQPHFTFNVLNTVGAMIYSAKKEKAYEYLSEVSEMLRAVLDHSSHHVWKLADELRFIRIYVGLENARFDHRFHFEEKVTGDLNDKRFVPRMMVQTFIENAIRHGLSHKKNDCKLVLGMEEMGEHLEVIIEDNGIGRKKSSQLAHTTGKGIGYVGQYIKTYNRMARVHFKLLIEDLHDQHGEASGTRVTLSIPLNFKSLEH